MPAPNSGPRRLRAAAALGVGTLAPLALGDGGGDEALAQRQAEVAGLEVGADAIDIRVEHTDAGARLTFTTGDPALVDALHPWGAARVRDHGEHAEHGSG